MISLTWKGQNQNTKFIKNTSDIHCAVPRLSHTERIAPVISHHLTNCLDDKAAANGE